MAANEIYGHFDRQFSEGTLDSWVHSTVDDNDFPSLNLSNRYLTPTNEAHGLEAIPFDKGVDPRGILQNMTKGDGLSTYVHTEDNQVQYFSTKIDTEGNMKSVERLFEIITTNIISNIHIQIHQLRAANVPHWRYCASPGLFRRNPYERRSTKDVDDFTLSSFVGWEPQHGGTLNNDKFNF